MSLAFAGWNYELVAPLAVAAVGFAVYASRNAPVTSSSTQFKRSAAFWGIGLALALAIGLLLGQLTTSDDTPSTSSQFMWSVPQLHKALALSIGALLVTYVPFLLIAVLTSGNPWRSRALFALTLTLLLAPLFAVMPFLCAAGAIISCALLQVQQCL